MSNERQTSASSFELALAEIDDPYIQKNFAKIMDFFRREIPLIGFVGVQIKFTSVKSSYKIKHTLGIVPQDIIVTSLKGDGSVEFNYANFTETELELSVTGTVTSVNPTTIRFLVGTMEAKEIKK